MIIFELTFIAMKKASYLFSAMLMVACFTQPVSAQFEGQITYESYEYEGEQKQKNDEFALSITPDRILLQGEKQYNFMDAIETEGVLVRLDFEDFVFLTGEDNVLRISKTDITSFMNMVSDEGDAKEMEEDTEDINYERSGESQTIQGYNCEKFIFRDDSEGDEYMAVWMTKDINVNWGMLAEPWSGNAKAIIENFPMKLIFEENYFPVRVESYDGNELESVLEASEINESPIARAMVNIPSGVQVLGLWDFLSRKANEQN